jgi:lipopolysaccharide transport system ATP-binding protein
MFRIRVQELGKSYPVYRKPADSLKEFLLGKCYHETVWAVRDVDLAVRPGSAVGIVGDNGAGKTTLLKMLAGAITPTCGQVDANGRLSAILDLGAGFHTDLSGLENIKIGCAVMGLSPAQTAEHLPGIVSFSELGPVLDRPLKTYSSGMYLRLGFSVATTINPDILVVDEHLSVGDQHFRKKCMDRINRLLGNGTALIFCSHDFYAVREVCSDCLWLRDGRPAMFGATVDVLDAYQDYIRARDGVAADLAGTAAPTDTERAPGGETCLREVTLAGDCRGGAIDTGGTLEVAIRVRIDPDVFQEGVHVGTLIIRNDRQWCYAVSTKVDGLGAADLTPLGGHEYGIRLVFDNLPLLAGQYGLTVGLLDDTSPHFYDVVNSAAEFKVRHSTGELGMVRLPHRWEAY